ncbi:MAG: ABC transporter permease [Planctomycetota bacterium]|nr:ABC transporter permease [Planctomycetota bacterium]
MAIALDPDFHSSPAGLGLAAALHLRPLLPMADANWFTDNWGWIVGGLIVGIGLIGFGRREVTHFSLRRTWAISGVCFSESIRKRVLWITPLAILGVIVVTQLERAFDEADAIRQTIKFCLFASGMVVILTSVILACTNLPKEIETRVIYTIVTKPITRLEIVLGKVVGFARVSLAILLIMGVFTSLYLHGRARGRENEIADRLREGEISDTERARLSHYQQTGLLSARDLWAPDSLEMYGRPPDPKSNVRVFNGEQDQDLMLQYPVDPAAIFGPEPASGNPSEWAHQNAGESGIVVRVRLDYQRTGEANDQPAATQSSILGPTTAPTSRPLAPPVISIEVMDENQTSLFTGPMIGASTATELAARIIDFAKTNKVAPDATSAAVRLSDPMTLADGTRGSFAYGWVPPESAALLLGHPSLFVRVVGLSKHTDYLVDGHPVDLFVPRLKDGQLLVEGGGASLIPGPMHTIFRGRLGLRLEQQLKGGADEGTSVAVFSFRNAPPPADSANLAFEITTQIQRDNSDIQEGQEDATALDMNLVDVDNGKSTPVTVQVESRRPAFFSLPANAVSGGNYDLVVRCRNTGHLAGFFPASLQLVVSTENFEWNLLKSLSILWMMSILVIALAVACSTFLSWPIAIVLVVVLLLGRWGVNHLADTTGADLGRQIVNDFKVSDAPVAKVVSSSVETLSATLRYVARVLPDPSSFDAIDKIEQGISVPSQKLAEAFAMMGGFGVPAIVIGYLILKNKEVAP